MGANSDRRFMTISQEVGEFPGFKVLGQLFPGSCLGVRYGCCRIAGYDLPQGEKCTEFSHAPHDSFPLSGAIARVSLYNELRNGFGDQGVSAAFFSGQRC